MKWKVIALGIVATLALAQKKPKPAPEPPRTWPTARTLAAPCDAVWPLALQAFVRSGWNVKTSDRTGGLLMLEWTKGYQAGFARAINPLVSQHTTAKVSGFSHQFTFFQIVSASAISAPDQSRCRYTLAIVYHGDEIGKDRRVLESNGWLESKLLDEIEAKLPK